MISSSQKREIEKEKQDLLKRMESQIKPETKIYIAQALSFQPKTIEYKVITSTSGTSNNANIS